MSGQEMGALAGACREGARAVNVLRQAMTRPRCALHGPMRRRERLAWWVCPGFDGEGCWVPVVTDELLYWWIGRFSRSLLMIPLRPAGYEGPPPGHRPALKACECPGCPSKEWIRLHYGPAIPPLDGMNGWARR